MNTSRLQINDKKNIAIVYRIHTDTAVKAALQLTQWLKKKEYEIFTAPEQKKIAGTNLMKSARDFKKISLVIVLGGDGTYLRAVRLMQANQVPILGFNMGSLGYLAHHPPEKLNETLEKTLNNEMFVQSRSRLEVQVMRKGKKTGTLFPALNDVVLERGSNSQLIHAALDLEGNPVQEIKADGFIISTPTGSTAYNLAAGGPILDPAVQSFVITPVAPHSLTHRPLVIPDAKTINLKMLSLRTHLVVDGQKVIDLKLGDQLQIQKSEIDHQLVIPKNHNSYNLLKKKLHFGSRS